MVEVKETLEPQMDETGPATLKENFKTSSTSDSNGNCGIVTDDEDPSPPPSPIIYRTRAYKRRHEGNPEENDQQNLEIQKQHEEKRAIAKTPRKKAKRTATPEELELEKHLKEEERRRKKEEREAAAQARRKQKELQKEAARKAREERSRVKLEKEEAARRAKEEKQRLAEEKKLQQEKVSGNNEFHGPRSLSASTSAVIPVHSNTTGFRSSLPAFVPSSPLVSPESSPVLENPSINHDDTAPSSPSPSPINPQDCESPKSRPNSTKRVTRSPRRRRDIRSCLNPMNDSDDEFVDGLMFDATNDDMDIRPTWEDPGTSLTHTGLNMVRNSLPAPPRILQKSIEIADEEEIEDPKPAELLPSRSYCCIM